MTRRMLRGPGWMYISSLLVGREIWTRPCNIIEYLCSILAKDSDYRDWSKSVTTELKMAMLDRYTCAEELRQ